MRDTPVRGVVHASHIGGDVCGGPRGEAHPCRGRGALGRPRRRRPAREQPRRGGAPRARRCPRAANDAGRRAFPARRAGDLPVRAGASMAGPASGPRRAGRIDPHLGAGPAVAGGGQGTGAGGPGRGSAAFGCAAANRRVDPGGGIGAAVSLRRPGGSRGSGRSLGPGCLLDPVAEVALRPEVGGGRRAITRGRQEPGCGSGPLRSRLQSRRADRRLGHRVPGGTRGGGGRAGVGRTPRGAATRCGPGVHSPRRGRARARHGRRRGRHRGQPSQPGLNRPRVRDERRLFHVVASRARRRVVFTASEPHAEATVLTARSRFVSELGVAWTPAPRGPFAEPLSIAEAAATWRRAFADTSQPPRRRLAALRGLLALGNNPARWWFQRDWTGSDRPLHENIRVSFSKLDTLENCALQYVLSEELGLEGRAGYYAWVGHLV